MKVVLWVILLFLWCAFCFTCPSPLREYVWAGMAGWLAGGWMEKVVNYICEDHL